MRNRNELADGCIDCGEILQTWGSAYCSCKSYNDYECIEGAFECVEGKEHKCPLKRCLIISTKNKSYFFEISDNWENKIRLVEKEQMK